MTRTRLVFACLSAAVGLGLAACVDNGADAPMLILRNIAPGEGCVVDTSSTDAINSGRIETDATMGYILTPLVRNDLTVVTGEPTAPKTIFLEGAHVEISFYDTALGGRVGADSSLLKFTAPVSGAIEPGGGTAALIFEVVPLDLIRAIAPEVADTGASTVLDVHVQMFGQRGGSTTESNVFRFPVTVCHDCITNIVPMTCANLPQGFTARTGGACNMFQDGIVDCCLQTADAALVCPAAAPPGT